MITGTLVGQVAVDSGQIMIIDPCYIEDSFNNQFDGFTLFDHDAVRRETHGVKHFYCDSTFDIGSFTRFANRI